MTEIEFRALAAQGYNRIPLLVECLGIPDTQLIDRRSHRGGRDRLEPNAGRLPRTHLDDVVIDTLPRASISGATLAKPMEPLEALGRDREVRPVLMDEL